MLAMLKHLANVREKEGRKVNLEYSELLKSLLDTLAAESDQTADEYLDKLVAEFETVEADEGEEAAAAAEGDVVEAAATPRPPRPLTATASRRPEPAAAVTVYVDDAVHLPGLRGGAAFHRGHKASGPMAELRAQAIALGAQAISRHADRELVKAVIANARAQYRP